MLLNSPIILEKFIKTMKQNILKIAGAFILISVISIVNPSSSKASYSTNTEMSTCKNGQCRATAKSTGNRCKHCVSNYGDSYCFQHK